MKVLIPLYAFYPSQIGGPCNTLYWLSKELVVNKIDVMAIVSDNGVDCSKLKLDAWENIDGIKVRYCTKSNSIIPLKIIIYSIINVKKSDVLIFSSVCYIPYFFIGLFALIYGKRIIWSPRGELFSSAIKNNKLKILYFKLLKLFFSKKVIFQSTSINEQKVVHKFFGNKCKCILLPNFMELPRKLDYEVSNYFLYIGRIDPIKAIDNLIIALFKSRCFFKSNYILKIAGSKKGKYYESLLNLIVSLGLSDKVEFLGMVKGEEKEILLSKAKVNFLVSHSENFGNTVIESLAQGTPVVASKGTPWQSLNDYNAGYWVDNDPDTISKIIDEIILKDIETYKKLRENAYNYCVNEFDIKKNIHKWIYYIKNNHVNLQK